jgi:hypothetical protein
MAHNYYHNEGYTRGGLDVVTGVNLFFKGLLLFPVFVLAGFIGLTMMKHVLFNGIPVMNSPSEEQREIIRERDSEIGSGTSVNITETIDDIREGWTPGVPELPAPVDNKKVESNCPVGHPMRNVLGANGLPWVCATSSHQYYTMDDNYTAQ